MKRTLYLSIVAVAFLGGQAFSEEFIPTSIEGYDPAASDPGNVYYGVYSETGEVFGGNVTVSQAQDGTDAHDANVTGARTEAVNAAAFSNKVTMTGGQVGLLYGGMSYEGEAYGNTAIMTGGQVKELKAGYALGEEAVKDAYSNVAIVTGGVSTSSLFAGYSGDGQSYGNQMHLVGKGAKDVAIADATGNVGTYSGSDEGISASAIASGRGRAGNTNNSIDIYGSGVKGADMRYFDILNFHLVDGLATAEPVLTLTSDSLGLTLTDVEMSFFGDAVTDWSEFNGASITLVQTAAGITGIEDGTEVSITDVDEQVLATAKLALANEGKTLMMSDIKSSTPTPEPTTGTLSLLALAALCMRRRRN